MMPTWSTLLGTGCIYDSCAQQFTNSTAVVKLHVQIHLCFYSSQSVSCDVLFLSMDRVAKCLGACDLSEHH